MDGPLQSADRAAVWTGFSAQAAATAGPVRWFEPFIFVVYLLLALGIVGGAAAGAAHASSSGKVAYSQEQLDRYNSEARTAGQAAGLAVGLIALAIIASKVGYRGRDTFIQLIPIVGWVIWLKLLWRLACVQRNYWSPAPR